MIIRRQFSLWMALQERLSIAEKRISRWNLAIDMPCRICNSFIDSYNHIFGDCNFSRQLWIVVIYFIVDKVEFTGFDEQCLL